MKYIKVIMTAILCFISAYNVYSISPENNEYSNFQQDKAGRTSFNFIHKIMGIGVDFGVLVPLGEFGNTYVAGVSFSGQLEIYPAQNYFAYVKTGYLRFDQDSRYFNYNFEYSSYPLLFGAAYTFPRPGIIPYVGLEAGLHFTRYKEGAGNNLVYVERITEFGGGLLFGMKLLISDNIAGEAKASYNLISTESQNRFYFGILFGLNFKI